MLLYESGKIGTLELKNRMVVSAMLSCLCPESGEASEKMIRYHEAKAKGGFGLIITEDYVIAENVGAAKTIPGLWKDDQIASHRKLTDAVHAAGGKIACQIYHAGRESSEWVMGGPVWAPSAIKDPTSDELPHAMTIDEIRQVIGWFGDCAKRAEEAGFDAVEIHGAHGYLVNQFMSGFSNKRTDEYGGDVLGRVRFAVEVVKDIKEKCGNNYPLLFRMSAEEYVDGGLTIAESMAMAQILEEAGVDAFHVSQGVYKSMPVIIPPTGFPLAGYIDNAAAIKSVVSVPVIAAGRINDPYVAEAMLKAGKTDFCTMARASLADPEMPRKMAEGRYEDIIHCIGCEQGCLGKPDGILRCLVNPMTAMEDEYDMSPVAEPKNIVVVGGGVAGSEAAIAAASRGHKVILIEKSSELGGQWNLAAVPVGKTELASFTVWQKRMLNKLGVQVLMNTEATKEMLDEMHPDKVIVATGSNSIILRIPGVPENPLTAHDVLAGRMNPGHKVVVIGGGMVGAETAEFLAAHGHAVSVIEMRDAIAADCAPNVRYYLMKRMEEEKVEMLVNAAVSGIRDRAVDYKLPDGSVRSVEGVDTVLFAVGVRSNNALAQALEGADYEVVCCGDAQKARNGFYAIQTGFEAGMRA